MKRLIVITGVGSFLMVGLLAVAIAVPPTTPRVAAQQKPMPVYTTPTTSPSEQAQHHSEVRARAWRKFYSRVTRTALRRIR